MKNKKAVSALVATVLLVVITIAAVGMVWGAIMPIIRTNMEKSQKCFDTGLEIKQGGYTCYDTDFNLYIQVGRGEKNIEITNIQVQLSHEGSSKSFKISNSSILIENAGVVPGPLEDVRYKINMSAVPISGIDSASIAAVLQIGQTQGLCPATQPMEISIC